MDEFYEYWELIPDFDRFEEIGKVKKRNFMLDLNSFARNGADKDD